MNIAILNAEAGGNKGAEAMLEVLIIKLLNKYPSVILYLEVSGKEKYYNEIFLKRFQNKNIKILLFTPKKEFFNLKDSKNLEMITRIFFSQRRKMLKKSFNRIFKNPKEVSEKFSIDLNLRPQNLEPEIYYKLTKEYENLRS